MATRNLLLRFTNRNRFSLATMTTTNMATSSSSVGCVAHISSSAPSTSSPSTAESDSLQNLFVECVRSYIARAGSDVNWPLIARSTALMLLYLRRRHPSREWVRFLLRSRETFGEYHHLVRDMRLDDGQDFYRYFRMTRQRYVSMNLPSHEFNGATALTWGFHSSCSAQLSKRLSFECSCKQRILPCHPPSRSLLAMRRACEIKDPSHKLCAAKKKAGARERGLQMYLSCASTRENEAFCQAALSSPCLCCTQLVR